jgi:hypothetical protein
MPEPLPPARLQIALEKPEKVEKATALALRIGEWSGKGKMH